MVIEMYQKYGGKIDLMVSFLISDWWNIDEGEFGVLFNVGIIIMYYDYNVVYVDDNFICVVIDGVGNFVCIDNGDLVVLFNQFGVNYNVGYCKWFEVNYVLQWKLNDSMEMYFEGVYIYNFDCYNQIYYFFGLQNVVVFFLFMLSNMCFFVGLISLFYYGQMICLFVSVSYIGNYYVVISIQVCIEWGYNMQNVWGVKWYGDWFSLLSDLS